MLTIDRLVRDRAGELSRKVGEGWSDARLAAFERAVARCGAGSSGVARVAAVAMKTPLREHGTSVALVTCGSIKL